MSVQHFFFTNLGYVQGLAGSQTIYVDPQLNVSSSVMHFESLQDIDQVRHETKQHITYFSSGMAS